MKAALLTRFGTPERLQIVDMPPPLCGEGMVRVRVRAVGVNFADVFARLGVYPGIPDPPFVPGIEFAGDVVESRAGRSGPKVGRRVFGFSRQGAYAEEVCVPASSVREVPRSMSYRDAAAFLVTSLSAWHGLRNLAHARAGESVLIHAAAGGVGTACIQLCRHWKLRAFGTASTTAKLDVAREEGAELVMRYDDEQFREKILERTDGRGVDIVMDSVGGRVMRRSWPMLAPMGRYIVYGFAAAAGKRRLGTLRLAREALSMPLVTPMSFPTRNISLIGFNLYFLSGEQKILRRGVEELVGMYQRRILRPRIGHVLPFSRVVEAHRMLQARETTGKVVLEMEA